jgi:hypothetical protein
MLESSARRISELVGEDGSVLDVGGGARPFARADWVLDVLPYAARGQLGWDGDRGAERFGPDRWIEHDICAREPWPFTERQFDFAVCSHTLEDVRDPIWVAAELQRVAAAGYIEVPSLREELTHGIQGPWVGWGHHRWLVLVHDPGIEFVFKHHVVNRPGSHLPPGAAADLTARERVQTLWWEGGFDARERIMASAEELDGLLESVVSAQAQGVMRPPPTVTRLGRLINRSRLAGRGR